MENLQITKTIITQEATLQTVNARYDITVSVSGGVIQNLNCNVQNSGSGTNNDFIGNINLNGNHLNCTFPYLPGLSKYLQDFDEIITRLSTPETLEK